MAKFELVPAQNGQCFFRFKSDFGGRMLDSIVFPSKKECQQAVNFLQKQRGSDSLYVRRNQEVNRYWFECQDQQGQLLATSELYRSSHALENGISLFKSEAGKAPLVDLT